MMKKAMLSSRKNAQFGCLGLVLMVVSLIAFFYVLLLSRDFFRVAIWDYSRVSHDAEPNSYSSDSSRLHPGSLRESHDGSKMRILLGVFSVASKVERRNLLRVAYGIQHTSHADVTLRFIIGKPTSDVESLAVGLESLHHGDVMVLDIEENMNHGKSFTFFSSVAAGEARYDYVMKVDDDSYVRLENLAKSLAPLPREDLYYGYVLPCENQDAYAWYMAGMGYVLSWDLVEWVRESPIPRNATDGTEDQLMGRWLNEGKKAKNRVNKKPLFYDHPEFGGKCAHEIIPETILVHQVKNDKRWHDVLAFFERHRVAGLVAPTVANHPS